MRLPNPFRREVGALRSLQFLTVAADPCSKREIDAVFTCGHEEVLFLVLLQALDSEMNARRNRSRGPPSRQTRARTPPPTARMLAMGRVHKPFRREEEMRGKGKGKMPSQPPGVPGIALLATRKGQSVKGFSKGSKSRSPDPSESEESQDVDDDDDGDDDDEVVSDRPPENLQNASSRAMADHEPEGGHGDDGVVPDFIFAR